MTHSFKVGAKEIKFNLVEGEQSGYPEGLRLAAKFNDIKMADEGKFLYTKEVADPTNFKFNSGWRFTLVKPGKFRAYHTENPYVRKGAMDFAKYFTSQDPTAFVTDVVNFNESYEGNSVIVAPENKKSVDVTWDKYKYLLTYDPNTTVVGIYQNNTSVVAPDTLANIAKTGDVFDAVPEEFTKSIHYFFSKAILTALSGLPTKVVLEDAGDDAVLVNKKKVTMKSLLSPTNAEYLSSIITAQL